MSAGPVLLIGLDAADLRRIERLTVCGAMPNLAAIFERGARGRVSSRPAGLSAMIWPKWFEGGRAGSWYFPKQWNPDRMRLEWRTATRGDPKPFWCDLDAKGLRVCIVDVPQAPVTPLRHGLLTQGWQVHDLFERRTAPAGLWADLARKHGPPHLDRERYGPQSAGTLMTLREQLLAATAQAGEIGSGLMDRGPFDLFVIVLGALHRGGHYLWDLSQVNAGDMDPDVRRALERGLDDIYQAADRAIGRLVARAPPNSRIMIFSLHGMAPNNGWSEYLQSFAGAISGQNGIHAPARFLQKLKRVIPAGAGRRAVDLLPDILSSRILEITSARMHDWQHTEWFVLPSDLAGFLRLNLAGREARGIVVPGAQAVAVEDELTAAFSQLEDLEGRPIVAEVERTDDSIDANDRFRRYLPDLLLNWGSTRACATAGLRLKGRELARWPLGQRFGSGRSGNHVTEGWFAAIGPGVMPGCDSTLHDIDRIVPTVYRWLELELPERFVGSAFASLSPSEL